MIVIFIKKIWQGQHHTEQGNCEKRKKRKKKKKKEMDYLFLFPVGGDTKHEYCQGR